MSDESRKTAKMISTLTGLGLRPDVSDEETDAITWAITQHDALKARVSALRHDCGKAEVDISERDFLIDELKARVEELEKELRKLGVLDFFSHPKGEQHE